MCYKRCTRVNFLHVDLNILKFSHKVKVEFKFTAQIPLAIFVAHAQRPTKLIYNH